MMDLHGQIMNIKCEALPAFPFSPGPIASEQLHAYKVGHRDARHAAAELALMADACIVALRELEAMAERYRPPGYPIPDAQRKAREALAAIDAAMAKETP
jgi:hypothetical protein